MWLYSAVHLDNTAGSCLSLLTCLRAGGIARRPAACKPICRAWLLGFAPAGDVVFMSTYALHRSPDVWEDPLRFDPDRSALLPLALRAACNALHPAVGNICSLQTEQRWALRMRMVLSLVIAPPQVLG